MKLLSVILSIYIMALAFAPCADAHTHELNSDNISLTEQNQHQSSNDVDLCSPFCSCACCQSVSQPEYNRIALIIQAAQSVKANFIVDFFASPSISFWRPPQI